MVILNLSEKELSCPYVVPRSTLQQVSNVSLAFSQFALTSQVMVGVIRRIGIDVRVNKVLDL